MLTLSAKGQEVFRDVKAISILPPVTKPGALGEGRLFVYDPDGTVSAYLKTAGIGFTALAGLTPPPVAGKVWLIGRDAFKPAESTTNAFAAYADGGGRVIVLEQQNPLRFQGLNPAEAEAASNLGRTAFVEGSDSPILNRLQDKDFFTWEPGEIVYRNAYVKP